MKPTNFVDYRKVQKVTYGKRSFASKLEAKLFQYLELLQKGGEIADIQCQPQIYLTDAKIKMIPDFRAFHNKLDKIAYWEAKGFETDVWRIKRRLWTVYGPGPLFVFKGNAAGIKEHEAIYPK